MGQDGAKVSQDGPRWAKMTPRSKVGQDGAKMSQDGAKMAPKRVSDAANMVILA